MNSRERARLRTRLRQVNIEFSALIRDRASEGRLVRIAALKNERQAIMSLLFDREHSEQRVVPLRKQNPTVGVLHAAE
jgi:hypothetical protein